MLRCDPASVLSQGPIGRSEGLLGSGLQSLRVFSQHLRPPNAPASRCPTASPAPQHPLCCSKWNQFSWEVVKVRPQLRPQDSAGNTRGPSGADRRVCVCACVCAHVHCSGQALKQRLASRSCEICQTGQGEEKRGRPFREPYGHPWGTLL